MNEELKQLLAWFDNYEITFKFRNEGSRTERLLMALHHSCTLDPVEDREMLLGIMKKCAVWYCNYCDWEGPQDE